MDVVEQMFLVSRLNEMEAEIAKIRGTLNGKPKPMIFNEKKMYVAVNSDGLPGILLGRNNVYAFYCGDLRDPTRFCLGEYTSPQKAIDEVSAGWHKGRVYEFDTIREAMTFFLEHLKEEE